MARGIRIGTVVLIAVLAALATAAPAAAQGGSRVREELARTDEMLERATAFVSESESLHARELLDRAVRIQRDAREHLEGGRLLMAGRLTLEARGFAGRAVQLAREETSTRTRAEREMERCARALEIARESLRDAPPPASHLLSQATALLERSRASFREQQFNASLRLALAALRMTARAQAQAPGGGGHRVQRELERTDHLLERLREVGLEGDDARARLARAGELQDGAWAAFRDGRPEEAALRTREARAIAHRLRSETGPGIDEESVADALRETQALLDRAAEAIGPGGDGRAAMVLERAVEHQQRARAALESGQLRPALAQTRVARNLAARALEQSGSRGID